MASDAITMRLARPGDAGTLAAMSRDLIETGLAWRYSADRIARLIRDPDTAALLACGANGSVLGFAILQFGEQRGHLVLLCVQPAQRRRGVGRQLVDWLCVSAQVAGLASLHLELRADNEGALGFYRSLGFTETGVVPGYYAPHLAARRMVRVLRERQH